LLPAHLVVDVSHKVVMRFRHLNGRSWDRGHHMVGGCSRRNRSVNHDPKQQRVMAENGSTVVV
jgi:hypothetical protein